MSKYDYYIQVGNPVGYDVIYDRKDSYFYDQNHQPALYYGGMIAMGGSWGDGSQNTPLSGKYPLPAGFKVKWFSIVEDAFWEGDFKLDQSQMLYWVNRKSKPLGNWQNPKGLHNFIINATPGGQVYLWLTSGTEQILIGSYQAEKVTMDWQDFAKPSIGYNVEREKFRQVSMSDFTAKDIKRFKDFQENPIDVINTWKPLLKRYSYQLEVKPFKVVRYRMWFINQEILSIYSDAIIKKQPLAVPSTMYLVVKLSSGEDKALLIRFDEKKISQQFADFFATRNHGTLLFDINDDFKDGELYLVGEDGYRLLLATTEKSIVKVRENISPN